MGPPQLPVRIGELSGRPHDPDPPSGVHSHHLDGIEVVDHQSMLPGQQAVSPARDMAARADAVADPSGKGDSPALVQLLVDIDQTSARLDGKRTQLGVVVHGVQIGEIQDDLDVGIAGKVRETVTAATHRDPFSGRGCRA